jgi:hypothetical protein
MNRRRAIPIPFLVPGVLRRKPPGLGFLPSGESGDGDRFTDFWDPYDYMSPRDSGWYGAGGGGDYYYQPITYDYGYQDPGGSGGYGPGDTIYMPPTTERLPLPRSDWDPLHLFTPWLYDPGIYDFTYDPGIPPVPRSGATPPRRPTTPTTPTAPRRPSPGSSGTTRPTPQNQQCRAPFIYDAKNKKCVLPPCPEGQAFSISQNRCVPIPQLTAADEVKEPFPWWIVVLIGTGLVIATSRP